MTRILLIVFTVISQPLFSSECVNLDLYVNSGAKLKGAESHPCGLTFNMCLTKITETKDLSPTWAFELSEKGKVIAKWPMPVDAQVWSVSKSDIFVAFPNYRDYKNGWEHPNYVKISSDGFVSRMKKVVKSKNVIVECSRLTKDQKFRNSFCHQFEDLESSLTRTISFEPVCS